MFKWLGKVHVAFAGYSNWLVKVANALQWLLEGYLVSIGGLLGSFYAYAVLHAHRLKYTYKYLIRPLNSTRLSWTKKSEPFFTRINRIGLLGNCIPKIVQGMHNCVVS